MGLDVYLCTTAEVAADRRYSEAANALYAREDYRQLTEGERTALHAALPSCAEHASVPSRRHPGHLFGRRYLRSSYNGNGFNAAVSELLGSMDDGRGTLTWIFEPVRSDHQRDVVLTTDSVDVLRQAKGRALDVATDLRSSDRLRVMTVSHNAFIGIQRNSDNDALRLYREAIALGRVTGGRWWSSRDLTVFGDGTQILAATPGVAFGDSPGVHLIYRLGDEVLDSYVQAAEIVAEFCDEAVALIEQDGFCSLVWSE